MEDTMSVDANVRSNRHDPDHISIVGVIAEVFIIVAAAILFNFFPQHVGFVKSATDPSTFTPLLGPGFAAFLPWLNTYWLWAFCLCLAHLTLQRWTLGTRLIDLGLDLFGAAIFAAMFADSPFLEVPVATFAAKSALLFVCIAFLLGALDQFIRLLKWKPRAGQSKEVGQI